MVRLKDGFRGSRAIVLPPSVVCELERDPFASQLHVTDIGYFPNAAHHFRSRREGISQYVFIYCVEGAGWFELDGHITPIARNQFFILPAGKPHAYGADNHNPWTIYWFHFKGALAPYYAEGFDRPVSIEPSLESRIAERISIFEEIYSMLERGYGRENTDYALSSLYYFLGSIKYVGSYREVVRTSRESSDVVQRAVLYMRENLEANLTLEQLSDYVGYSQSCFSATFRRRMGYSPMNYLARLKMQAACRLLDFTDMKINQICHKVGISDPYYFTKLFTRIIGVPPTAYRSMMKG